MLIHRSVTQVCNYPTSQPWLRPDFVLHILHNDNSADPDWSFRTWFYHACKLKATRSGGTCASSIAFPLHLRKWGYISYTCTEVPTWGFACTDLPFCYRCTTLDKQWTMTVIEQNGSVHVPLTSACWVHSNVYGLVNIHCIRYHTVVDPFHSTSSAVHTYHHLISGSVEVPLVPWSRNPSFIGKEPVSQGRPISIRWSAATSS